MKDGRRLAVEWAHRIHTIAFDPNLQIGALKKQFLGKLKRPTSIKLDKPVPQPGRIIVAPSAIHRYEIMATEIATFPSSLWSSEVYARLKAALKKVGLTLDPDDNADRRAVGRAMDKARYGCRNIGGNPKWAKGYLKPQKAEAVIKEHTAHTAIYPSVTWKVSRGRAGRTHL
jgi:hypothetical protein